LSTGKTFALAIALKASIDGSIAAGVAKAAQSIQSVAQTTHAVNAQMEQGTAALRKYEGELANIGAKSAQFMTLKRAIQDNSNSLTEARARADGVEGRGKQSVQPDGVCSGGCGVLRAGQGCLPRSACRVRPNFMPGAVHRGGIERPGSAGSPQSTPTFPCHYADSTNSVPPRRHP